MMGTPPPADIPRPGQIIDVRMRVVKVFMNGEHGWHCLAEFVRPNGLPIDNAIWHAIDSDVFRKMRSHA